MPSNLANPWCSKVIPVFHLNQTLSMFLYYNLYVLNWNPIIFYGLMGVITTDAVAYVRMTISRMSLFRNTPSKVGSHSSFSALLDVILFNALILSSMLINVYLLSAILLSVYSVNCNSDGCLSYDCQCAECSVILLSFIPPSVILLFIILFVVLSVILPSAIMPI